MALGTGGFKNAFLNSLAVAIPSTVIPITFAAYAAYAFSWMQFRGRHVLFVLVVGLMVVPSGRAGRPGHGLRARPRAVRVRAPRVLLGAPARAGGRLRAMRLSIAVAVSVAAIAADAVTGLVAGPDAGGAMALRADAGHSLRGRFVAVTAAAMHAFVLVRVAGGAALTAAPILPFTAVGLADQLAERRGDRRS